MASGGARSRSGPAKDPNSLRSVQRGMGLEKLPVEGRPGSAPDWPLDDDEPTPREWETWTRFWRKPQAIIWERDQIFEPVAMFVRQYIEGMDRRASAENRKTVRLMFADLYLTSDSLTRAGYCIGPREGETEADVLDIGTGQPVEQESSRDRLLQAVPNVSAD